MYKINSLSDDLIIVVPENGTILEATLSANINHIHACGGNARCSTCRVHVRKGLENCLPRNEAEQEMAEKLRFPASIRLACQTQISGNVSIHRAISDDLDIDIISKQFGDDTGTQLGKEQNLAILFTDIVNYTTFAESLPGYDIVHVLNRYFQKMNDIISANNGLISDVAGDGILALFGIDNPENPVRDAVKSVQEMRVEIKNFNQYLRRMYGHEFGIRAGIHYGTAIVGNFETGHMKKIAAIGDAVNLASRIETANKTFGTEILLSKSAYELVKSSIALKASYETDLKGKTGVFELVEPNL
ncbi:MAG: adenylate/guanylate cyclase domain-containing protein [Bacteroidota bacterium]